MSSRPSQAGDEEVTFLRMEQTKLSKNALRVLEISERDDAKRSPTKRFWDMYMAKVEEQSFWPRRVMLWDWMKKCLRGSSQYDGQWYYLTKEVSEHDVALLLRTLTRLIDIPNLISFGSRLKEFYDLKRKPNEDVFSFFQRMDDKVQRLNSVRNSSMKMCIEEWQVVHKMIEAAINVPIFKLYFDNMSMTTPDAWHKITRSKLLKDLRVIGASQMALQRDLQPGHDSNANFAAPPPQPRVSSTHASSRREQSPSRGRSYDRDTSRRAHCVCFTF